VFPILLILLGCSVFFTSIAQAESTLLYQEDFEDGQADAWQEQTDTGAIWQVINGKYHLNIPTYRLGAKSIYQNGFAWQNYILSLDVELNDGVDRNIIFRWQDEQNYYFLGLRGFWRFAPDDTPVIYLAKCYQGQCTGNQYYQYFAAYHFDDNNALNNETAHIDIEAIDNRIKVFYNNELIIDWQETTEDYPKSGTIGLRGWSGDHGVVDVAWDNIVVKTALPEESAEPDPVIIVPGIMGSWESGGKWQLDPILHTYDNLIEAMVRSGFELNQDLFLFPYDWREDNVLTAALLKQKIDEIKQQTESEKVDIVAHSMGGLISRYYIQSSEYENDVDQLMFLNTPHQGSPETYLAYEGAYILGKLGRIKKFIFQTEATKYGYLSLPKYIREQVLSTEQLLPIYDYLQEEVNNDWQYRMYPVQYPRNSFLENLDIAPAIEILKQRVEITNIYSSAGLNSTLNAIKVVPDPDIYDSKWIDGYPHDIEDGDFSSLVAGNGDGTVPIESLNFLSGVDIIEFNDVNHREIITQAQQDVIEILTNKRPEDYYSGPWSVIKRVLFIRVYSPVDFVVIAPDGNMIGKDFTNNIEINQIAGAFYSGFDSEAEFVTIINPIIGDYQVKLQGIENGTYKLGIDILEDNNLGEQEENLIPGIISVGEEEVFNFNYEENDEASKITIQKEIDFNDLIKDLDELYSNNEIERKSVYNYLSVKFSKLSKIYDKTEDEELKKRAKRINRFIKETNKIQRTN